MQAGVKASAVGTGGQMKIHMIAVGADEEPGVAGNLELGNSLHLHIHYLYRPVVGGDDRFESIENYQVDDVFLLAGSHSSRHHSLPLFHFHHSWVEGKQHYSGLLALVEESPSHLFQEQFPLF